MACYNRKDLCQFSIGGMGSIMPGWYNNVRLSSQQFQLPSKQLTLEFTVNPLLENPGNAIGLSVSIKIKDRLMAFT